MAFSPNHVVSFPRRKVLGAALAVSASASFGMSALGMQAKSLGVLKTWGAGIQLYTVNEQLKADVPGTLKAIKSAGFDLVETAGTAGLSNKAFAMELGLAGLKCVSAHTDIGSLKDHFDQVIDHASTLGATWLVCASPLPPVPVRPDQDWLLTMMSSMTLDAWKYNADQLALAAPKVAAAGLKLAYHNHPMEWKDLGNNVCGYDILMAGTDADHLRCELDLAWVYVGGRDPVQTLRRYAGRVDLIHIKDIVQDPSSSIGFRSVELGKGLLDWRSIFEIAARTNVKQILYEQEPPFLEPVFKSLINSHKYLESL